MKYVVKRLVICYSYIVEYLVVINLHVYLTEVPVQVCLPVLQAV
jgi:hypothetical protein